MVGYEGWRRKIRFDAVIERLAPEVPRFFVYAGKAWDETATFIVDISLNRIIRSTAEELSRCSLVSPASFHPPRTVSSRDLATLNSYRKC
jgi:hypothetical protein